MKYKVLSNLQTGEGTFVAGDEIEMDEKMAESLVADGVLAVVEEKPKEEPEAEPREEKEEVKKPREKPKKKGK